MNYWYIKVLRQYADFEGRARRKEFWMFGLYNLLLLIGATFLDFLLGFSSTTVFHDGLQYTSEGFGPIYTLYSLATFIPSIAVAVRRLHDVGKSGWMILVTLIPLIGVIWFLALALTDSIPGKNEYGPNPKGVDSDF